MGMMVSAAAFVVSILLTVLSSCESENECGTSSRECVHVTALIPARAGSKGIKDKNLSLLGNETLVGRTVRIIKECGEFDSIWVSTDGEKIARVAEDSGAQVHWRNPETATDNATTLSAVQDFLESHQGIEIIATVQCTSPFIQSKFLCEALNFIRQTDVDCVFSATRSHKLRWVENEDGRLLPINFDPKNRPRRQDWRGEFVENGMFYFAKVDLIRRDRVFQNDRCKAFEIPKNHSLEIDTIFDLKLARMTLELLKE